MHHLQFRKKLTFVVFNKDLNVLAVISSDKENNYDPKDYSVPLTKENYTLTHVELHRIIESKDLAEHEMDLDVYEEIFSKFKLFFKDSKFKIVGYSWVSSEVTGMDIFQPNSLIVANWFDKILRLYDAWESSLNGEEQRMQPFRDFSDIVLKRKFAGGMFYKVPEDKDVYLLTGIEKAGELIAYSVKLGSQYTRIGNWKEGWEYITYFYNDMKNFMIVYITCMWSVVIWRKPIIKNFQALSPNFVHIEQNQVYIPTDEAAEEMEVEYVEPRSSLKLKSCFKKDEKEVDIKSIPAKLYKPENTKKVSL